MALLNNNNFKSRSSHLRATSRHLQYGITRCYLSPDTSELAPPNPGQAGWYSIYLPRSDGRLSCPRWLLICPDALPVSRQSPIQVVTGPDMQVCWSRPALRRAASRSERQLTRRVALLMRNANWKVLC